ncbi:cuticle protein-like [Neocloeon triangulifer]|uniref:cuticle protein-like n=1 Tax=Neocloeon triangulifer TaxID=2078957 RepID=UPI00286F7C09|nr:cuticle protein-like [Neocloeon triangulifer]
MAFKLVALLAVLAAARAGTVQTVVPFGFAAPAFAPGLNWIQAPSQYGTIMPRYSFDSSADAVLNQLTQEIRTGDVILRATFDIVERDGKVRTVAYYEDPSVIYNFVANKPTTGAAASAPNRFNPNQPSDILNELKHETRNGGIILKATFDLVRPDGTVRTVSYYEESSTIFNFVANKAPVMQSLLQRPINGQTVPLATNPKFIF